MTSAPETTFEPAPGSEFTIREITQQPRIWRETAQIVAQQREGLDDFLVPLLEHPHLRIVLTGAGTSAFAGDIIAPAVSRLLHRRVDAVATTDIVSNPREYFAEDVPTLLISFARSGNSPESLAATDLADETLKAVSHLILTCDEDGILASEHKGRARSKVVLMPTPANDQGFAMTSSFTSMLLSCLLILGGPRDDAMRALESAAQRVIRSAQDSVRDVVSADHERVVYLGSGPLAGLARESALKLLELTAGKIVAYHDSSLGFRHGPKAVLNDKTLVLVFVSSDPYTQRYDLDIIGELRAALPSGNLITISTTRLDESQAGAWIFPELAGLEDVFLAPAYAVIAQLLALASSLHLGLTPDNPFPGGDVNRVVQGVRIHPLTVLGGVGSEVDAS